MDKERFSLLILEPNEIYFEDFLVTLLNIDNDADSVELINGQVDVGQLKMCSKSLVFDPKHLDAPIIKIAYKHCDRIYIRPCKVNQKETNVLAVSCAQYTEMLPKNHVAPYTFNYAARTFLFHFHYAPVHEYLDQLRQLMRASKLHACEQNDMIATIVYSKHQRVKFNPLWYDDFQENVLTDYQVDEIHPLILNPGRLLLTTQRIYFQPFNNIQPWPVIKIALKNINTLTKRRFLLRHVGLEIKWTENGCDHFLYVSFRNQHERDRFYDQLNQQDCVRITHNEQESMTLKWQNGVISNFDYLLYLNSLADRTFYDLTQYPVFPWVIRDYVSPEIDLSDPKYYRDLTKPVGALNEDRLQNLIERYDEMDEPKFLFGSHFSAPALVLFYLARKHPKLVLCLQNGHFDHPDRMFNSLSDTFRNCLNNMSDFKELIPEFYDPSNGGDFLVNGSNINFGKRADATPVNDVALPPWAQNSPQKFVQILRDALESDYVSQNLHHWIDLIFGYKQRGDEAHKAHNLFYHLCYEGAIDLENVSDLAKRHALEVQISEFGQIPKQLFKKPHVPRQCSSPMHRSLSIPGEGGGGVLADVMDANAPAFDTIEFLDNYQSHKDLISSVTVHGDIVATTAKDGLLKCYNMREKRQVRSVSIGTMPISTSIKVPNQNSYILASWDNSIVIYDCDYGRKINDIPAHDDAVSCLSYSDGVLASGSWDCSIKIWKGFNNKPYRLSDSLVCYHSFDEKVLTLDISKSANAIRVACGLVSGDVALYRLSLSNGTINSIESTECKVLYTHKDEVTAIHFNQSGSKIVSCSLDQFLYVCDVDTGMILFKKEHPNCLICLSWCFDNEHIYSGDNAGHIYAWNMMTGELNCTRHAFSGPVTSITSKWCADTRQCQVIVAGVDKMEYLIKAFTNK